MRLAVTVEQRFTDSWEQLQRVDRPMVQVYTAGRIAVHMRDKWTIWNLYGTIGEQRVGSLLLMLWWVSVVIPSLGTRWSNFPRMGNNYYRFDIFVMLVFRVASGNRYAYGKNNATYKYPVCK